MSLFDLPPEILHRVLDHCHKNEVYNIRLVNRFISAIADEHLLRNVFLFFELKAFDTIERLLQNVRIARGVKHLHFQADFLGRIDDYDTFYTLVQEALFELAFVKGLETPLDDATQRGQLAWQRAMNDDDEDESSPLYRDAYEQYKELRMEQDQMYDGARAQRCLETVLRSCSGLDSVIVAMGDEYFGSYDVTKTDVFRRSMLIPIKGLALVPIIAMFHAATKTQATLKRLWIGPLSYRFFAMPTPVLNQFSTVISHLQDIRIIIDHDVMVGPYEELEEASMRVFEAFQDGRLHRFLKGASSLRSLSIRYSRKASNYPHVIGLEHLDYPHMIGLEDIVGRIDWPQLETLELSDFQCKDWELADLLLRHRHTLTELILENVFFLEGDFQSSCDIVAGRMPKLKQVELAGVFRIKNEPHRGMLRLTGSRDALPEAKIRELQNCLMPPPRHDEPYQSCYDSLSFWPGTASFVG